MTEEEFHEAFVERWRETRQEDLRMVSRAQHRRRRIRLRVLVMLFAGVVAVVVLLARQVPFLFLAGWLGAIGVVVGTGVSNEVYLHRDGQRIGKLVAELASLEST